MRWLLSTSRDALRLAAAGRLPLDWHLMTFTLAVIVLTTLIFRCAGAVTREVVSLALTGTALGTLVAWLLTPFLKALLYGVEPVDLVSFAGTALLVVACATAGCVLAARRALRLEPAIALRAE